LFEVSGGRWNLPPLRAALEKLARQGEPFTGLEFPMDGRTVVCSARRIKSAGGGPPLILLSIGHRL